MTEDRKQKRNRLLKTRKIVTLALLLIVFFLLSIYYVISSDFFSLKAVEIIGNTQVSAENIFEVSGLIYNRNVFQYNLDEIKFNIKRHPYVENAIIKKRLPNQLIITINEREKYAIIPYMGRYIYIDHSLHVLQISEEYDFGELSLITGINIEGISLGERIQSSNLRELEFLMKVIEATKIVSINKMISEMNIQESGNISLILVGGIEVLLNPDNDPAYSIVTLNQLLTRFSTNDKSIIIDMRFEGGVSIKEK